MRSKISKKLPYGKFIKEFDYRKEFILNVSLFSKGVLINLNIAGHQLINKFISAGNILDACF